MRRAERPEQLDNSAGGGNDIPHLVKQARTDFPQTVGLDEIRDGLAAAPGSRTHVIEGDRARVTSPTGPEPDA